MFIVQEKALRVAGGLRELIPMLKKRDADLCRQLQRAMNSVVLNLAEGAGNDPGTARARFASACGSVKEVRAGLKLAAAYGFLPEAEAAELDAELDSVCAMSWRLSGR